MITLILNKYRHRDVTNVLVARYFLLQNSRQWLMSTYMLKYATVSPSKMIENQNLKLSCLLQSVYISGNFLRASFRIGKTGEDYTKVLSAETLKTQIDFMAYKIKAEVCFENLGRV